jgi:hypothetical protein
VTVAAAGAAVWGGAAADAPSARRRAFAAFSFTAVSFTAFNRGLRPGCRGCRAAHRPVGSDAAGAW